MICSPASQPIDAEFKFISRQTDALVAITSPQYGRLLVLTEVQLRYRVEMPYRMHAYAALAAEKYRLPVYPQLVRVLKHRFGSVGEEVLVKLRAVEASRLEGLIDVALDAESLDDFAAHLS